MNPILIVIIVLAVLLLILIVAFLLVGRQEARFTFDIGGLTPRAAGGADNSTESGFKSRLGGLGIFSGSIIGALLVKLWTMQLVSADSYSAQAESNRTRTISVEAPRGRILDRNGVELVTNRASVCVVAQSDVAQNDIECMLLGNLIGMPQIAVKRKIEDATAGAQSLRTVAVDVSRRVVSYINEHSYIFSGVSILEKTQRHYPLGNVGAHVVGYVGTVSSDQLAASKDSSDESAISYESGDTVGQSGIEYQYESVLQGIKGERTVYVDANGNILSQAGVVESKKGSDVVLTLDAKIQEAAEKSLQERIKILRDKGKSECKGGCVVCMDVTNGEILAMASAPTFYPNVFVGGISSDDWSQLSDESSENPLMNRVVAGQYPSASTIKPLSTFAALDFGIAAPDSSYFCTGYWTGFGSAYGQYCWNHNGHGAMNLQTGITFSCDVVFYEIGKGFYYSDHQEGLQDTFRKWGLGSQTGIDLPAESQGRVPDAEWKWNYFNYADDNARSWQGGDNTNLAIGQGDLLVTPLQMLCVYAGIATQGNMWRPHVMKSIRSNVGDSSVIDYKCDVMRQTEESSTAYDIVSKGLLGVIYEESEAQTSHFTNLSVKVAGKTGTAETSHKDPTGWFIVFAPADDPKYAIAAVIENGGYGSEGAMYVVRDVLGALYDEPDTSDAVDTSGVQ